MSAKRKRKQRKEPRQARSRETVNAILDAATRVLSREGYVCSVWVAVAGRIRSVAGEAPRGKDGRRRSTIAFCPLGEAKEA